MEWWRCIVREGGRGEEKEGWGCDKGKREDEVEKGEEMRGNVV